MGRSESKDDTDVCVSFLGKRLGFPGNGVLFSYLEINGFWPWPAVAMSFSLLL